MNATRYTLIAIFLSGLSVSACTPKVQLEAPEKPITINLNVKIEHQIRVQVDKDLEEMFTKDKGLF